MDFSNERYVRYYTRETTTFLLLSWEGQALLPHMLRLVDRSGVLDLGGVEPAEAVSVRLPRWPPSIVEAGVRAILDRGIVERHGDRLVWPRYLEAQEVRSSDAQRARDARARRRDGASVTNCDATVTKRDATVTLGHTASHGVTPAVPSRTVPSQIEDPPFGPPRGTEPSESDAPVEAPTESQGGVASPSKPVEAEPVGARTDDAANDERPAPVEAKAKRRRQLPEDFALTPEREAYARAQGCIEPAALFGSFADYHRARGSLMADWDAAWRTWCRNDRRFGGRPARGAGIVAEPVVPAASNGCYSQWLGLFARGFRDPELTRQAWVEASKRNGGEDRVLAWCRANRDELRRELTARDVGEVRRWLKSLTIQVETTTA